VVCGRLVRRGETATASRSGDMSVFTMSKSTNEVLSCMQTAQIVRGTTASRCTGSIDLTRVPARKIKLSDVGFAINIEVLAGTFPK
jgi:hypothetical protein